MPTRVLPDANVLHARTLRDWLLLLKDTGNASMFHVFYTEDILAETIQSIRRRNPDLTGTEITKIRDPIAGTMDGRIDDYPSGQDVVALTDPFDRHIHAAAVAGAMDYVVSLDRGFTDLTSPRAVADTSIAGALMKSDCPGFAERITKRCREIALAE